MAAWHDDTPGVGRNFYVGLAFALYLTAALALIGWVLWRIVLPLPHLIP